LSRSLGSIAFAAVALALARSPRAGAQTPISIRAADGGTIAADSYGAGPHGVVLAHGGRFDRSSWKDLASQMAAIGFRVVAIDFRAAVDARAGRETPCLYNEHCLAKDVTAAMRYLRTSGAKTISLVGASLGGGAVAQAAIESPSKDIDAVVLLAHMSVRSPDRIPGRKLFLVARYDTGDAPRLPEVRAQYERAAQPKQLDVLEGSAHAQFLFKTDQGPGLEYEILHFLTLSERVPAHDTFTVTSHALGELRLVNVHLPRGSGASAEHAPVLYMPDGGLDEDFPHVVNTVDSLAALGRIRPVIVVGIPNTERRRDLTGPTRVATDSAIAKHVGGSAAFRRFLRDELIPAVNARYRTTSERTLVGESLAGLFVVETFLTEPWLFQHYIALDPSLWWNAGALVDSAGTLLGALDSAPRTLFLATANVSDITMGTSRLAALLGTIQPRGLRWSYKPRPDLTHATIFRGVGPEALAESLR